MKELYISQIANIIDGDFKFKMYKNLPDDIDELHRYIRIHIALGLRYVNRAMSGIAKLPTDQYIGMAGGQNARREKAEDRVERAGDYMNARREREDKLRYKLDQMRAKQQKDTDKLPSTMAKEIKLEKKSELLENEVNLIVIDASCALSDAEKTAARTMLQMLRLTTEIHHYVRTNVYSKYASLYQVNLIEAYRKSLLVINQELMLAASKSGGNIANIEKEFAELKTVPGSANYLTNYTHSPYVNLGEINRGGIVEPPPPAPTAAAARDGKPRGRFAGNGIFIDSDFEAKETAARKIEDAHASKEKKNVKKNDDRYKKDGKKHLDGMKNLIANRIEAHKNRIATLEQIKKSKDLELYESEFKRCSIIKYVKTPYECYRTWFEKHHR